MASSISPIFMLCGDRPSYALLNSFLFITFDMSMEEDLKLRRLSCICESVKVDRLSGCRSPFAIAASSAFLYIEVAILTV